LPQQALPAAQQDFISVWAGRPQQSRALAQHSAPARQQGWAPWQQPLACTQQSRAWVQQASLVGAAQHAIPLPQQASFWTQQSFGALGSVSSTVCPVRANANGRTATANSFANMIHSSL
jgi:hypothetical protein